MKKGYAIIVILAALLVVAAGFQTLNKLNEKKEPQRISTSTESSTPAIDLESQTNNEGAATISVAPRKSANDGWEVEITLDTHSVELNDDLTKVAVLIVDNESYYPITWNGDPPGGHHREGVLIFDTINPTPPSVELKIKGVGGVPERSFKWNRE
ncbi:MAG: hypothetical protein A2128_00110 [Candidatus Liptonbacteria bacterium GWC1_60_9]|uniref:DUF4352 domain-containing protein n=2 Tax=Candidatus Liptoniibacteriota TaxID=1817909 RepID=A0A1G2CK20_9BACT|nr:MAG: hypothetical protein A2128_00110 [Candidatus Liptonbacteria bacterium GWC1_60_9]OGZ01753.1 MAG: hypothetical protein A3G64_01910 [Candidatus Liptonbacteria bacterium RIFCSPLOWO2_12_FULL_60_15]